MGAPPRFPGVIGHRGARAHAPENTLAGIAEAAAQGATWVEVDVKLSRDGVPVLIHDDTLTATTDGSGTVAASDFAQLRDLDTLPRFVEAHPGAGAAFVARHGDGPVRIPSLEQALALVVELRLGVNLEIKPSAGREVATAEIAIAQALPVWPKDRPPPLISSFARPSLEAALRVAPHWPRGLLIDEIPPDWRELAQRYDVASINPNAEWLTETGVAALLTEGKPVLAWTVNSPDRARELWRSGVTGLFTDHPGLLLKAIAPRQTSAR